MRLQGGTRKVSEAAGARWRFHARIMVGLSSNRLSIGGSNSRSFRWNLELADFVAGAVFGEVRGWLCVLRALKNTVSYVTRINHEMHFAWQAQYLLKLECDFSWQAQHLVTFWEIAGARNVVFFNTTCVSKVGRGRSPRRRVRDDDFMLGSWSDCRRIVFLLAEAIHGVSAEILNLQISWQAQYLVSFEVDFACSAHWKWCFIWDADQSWDSFCVAGAVFGEVGVWLFVAGAAFGDILGDSRSAKCCIFQYKIVSKIGRVRSPKRRVRDDDFILGSWSDHGRIVVESSFYWRKQFTEFPLKSWTYRFRGRRSIWWGWWLTVLAPRIVNDVSYVTRINHEICVAGAVFGELRGWLCLLCALEMTFHMRRGSIMRFILRGRRSIWWSWSVTFRGRRSIWWHFGR